VRLRFERVTRFPRDAVYAWWTDFREDDHVRSGSPATSVRRILRRKGNEVWLHDCATRPIRVTIEEHVTLKPTSGYAVEARYPGADVEYAYRFEPTAEGTRIVLEVSVHPRGLGRILIPLTSWWWRRYAARDLEFHLAEMAGDLSPR
jgi:hypothetical protein